MALVVVLHLGIVFGLPVPGCPTGYLGPGGKHRMAAHPNCTGGAATYIDETILTSAHMYQWGTARTVYDAKPFDPEGVFGCLLTLLQVFFGVQCGTTLMIHTECQSRIKRWLAWAFVTGLIGGALTSFSQENGIIPINKHLWSLSYVLVTVATSFILLTICYLLIDIQNWWSGSPFCVAGMNAIILYVGADVLNMLPWRWQIGPMNTHFVLTLENAWTTGVWILVAYYLHYKRIYFSL